jgi:hypothetical protein
MCFVVILMLKNPIRISIIIFKYAKCSNKFQRYFLFGSRFNFLKFWQIILKNYQNDVLFKVFIHQKWGRYIFFKRQIAVFDCQCVGKCIEGWQRTSNSSLVYSLTWLNLPHDDRQFSGNLSLDDGQCGFKTKVLTKAPNCCNVPIAAGWLQAF